MNQPISTEKFFEMYGRTSMERDLQREVIANLQRQLQELKKKSDEEEKG